MKKILMTLAAVLCCAITVSAQEDGERQSSAQTDRNRTYRITLGNVQYAHHNEKMSAGEAVGKVLTGVLTGQASVQATKYEEDVKNAIIKGLSGAHRYRYNDGLLQVGDIVEDGNFVADAIITNIQAKSSSHTWKDKDGKTQVTTNYTGVCEAMLTLKDAKTGEVIANPTFGGSGMSSSSYSDSDKAVRDAIGRLSNRITEWLNKFRPLQANIIEGSTAKKDKQKEVYIDLGSSEGAYEGLHMGVYIIKTVAGREAKSQIGKLKIEAVEGDDISRCKVQSGGKEIKAAIDAGEKLKVISID
ncbi:MAG: hypothetical protein IKR31_04670 [Prevotella sp.]|jgi:hypothetical protein|nr:hypothetical protein [Prevotella sp.]